MTDLLHALPDFDTAPYTHLLPSLDKALISLADLVTLEPVQVAKRAQLPPGDVRKLIDAIVYALHRHLGFGGEDVPGSVSAFRSALRSLPAVDDCQCTDARISTLDEKLDAALGGGILPGYLVEVTGESGVGKTQLLLTLLLASQLPSPRGLAKSAIYISTEAALATSRLAQLLASHPALASLSPEHRPSLSRILSIQTPDLESQEHILRYQLPVAIKKHSVGLVILDSVAANYRAEFDKKGDQSSAASMARRSAQLVQLGALLRDLARTEGIAVVVANQVADRFTNPNHAQSFNANAVSRTPSVHSQGTTMSSTTERENTPNAFNPLPSNPPSQREASMILSPEPLTLDHQQRWFTGWGDNQSEPPHTLKTPSLGLVWTNQIACRIALIKQPVFATRPPVVTINGEDQWNSEESHISKWRRHFKVVFAPWAAPSDGRGVEFEILKTGIRTISQEK